MKLSTDNVPAKVLKNFKGGEKEMIANMYSDDLNKILVKSVLHKGATVGLHKHETSSEIIFIISGCGKAICDGEIEYLNSGDVHYCKKGSSHTLINENDEDLVFFACVPEQ